MIHVVSSANRHLYGDQLYQMHQLRRVHFVEERGWYSLKLGPDGGEYDESDDECAVYLLGLDDAGAVEAAMRTRPTDDFCILADKFPQLIAPGQPPMKGPDVWEISRIFATKAYRTRREITGERRVGEIFLAAMEAAHARGARRIVGMVDVFLYPAASRCGWKIRMTGCAHRYEEGGEMVGVEIAAGAEDIRAFCDHLHLGGPASYEVADADLAGGRGLAEVAAGFDLRFGRQPPALALDSLVAGSA